MRAESVAGIQLFFNVFNVCTGHLNAQASLCSQISNVASFNFRATLQLLCARNAEKKGILWSSVLLLNVPPVCYTYRVVLLSVRTENTFMVVVCKILKKKKNTDDMSSIIKFYYVGFRSRYCLDCNHT